MGWKHPKKPSDVIVPTVVISQAGRAWESISHACSSSQNFFDGLWTHLRSPDLIQSSKEATYHIGNQLDPSPRYPSWGRDPTFALVKTDRQICKCNSVTYWYFYINWTKAAVSGPLTALKYQKVQSRGYVKGYP